MKFKKLLELILKNREDEDKIGEVDKRYFRRDHMSLRVTEVWEISQDIGMYAADLVHEMLARRCRECGCTQHDCHHCIEKTGSPCTWVDADLCSACAPPKRKKK